MNESGPRSLIYLNAWSEVGTVWEKIRRHGLVGGGVSLWVSLVVSEALATPSYLALSLCLMLMDLSWLLVTAPVP